MQLLILTRWLGATRRELKVSIGWTAENFVLQRKFDSPFFSEQWNQIAARINTKCRGKRRTLIHRLEKTCFENTKMAQLVYHFTQKIMGQWIEQS